MSRALLVLAALALLGCNGEGEIAGPPCYRVACNAIGVPGTACGVFRYPGGGAPVAIYPTGEEAIAFARRQTLPFCGGAP